MKVSSLSLTRFSLRAKTRYVYLCWLCYFIYTSSFCVYVPHWVNILTYNFQLFSSIFIKYFRRKSYFIPATIRNYWCELQCMNIGPGTEILHILETWNFYYNMEDILSISNLIHKTQELLLWHLTDISRYKQRFSLSIVIVFFILSNIQNNYINKAVRFESKSSSTSASLYSLFTNLAAILVY